MKKFGFIFLLFFSMCASAQLPNLQGLGDLNTEWYQKGITGADLGIRWRMSFSDTFALNAYKLGILKNIAGYQARVFDDIYMRSNDLKRWNKINGGGSAGKIDTVYFRQPLYVILDTLHHTYTVAIYDASISSSGVVNTGTQSFAGDKTNTGYFIETKKIGIGPFSSIPMSPLHIKGTAGLYGGVLFDNGNSGDYLGDAFQNDIGVLAQVALTGSTFTNVYGKDASSQLGINNGGNGGIRIVSLNPIADIGFTTGIGYDSADTRFRIQADGNITVGSTKNTLQRFTVDGSTLIKDTLSIGKTRIASNSDSAYVKDPITGKVAYAKINGSGSGGLASTNFVYNEEFTGSTSSTYTLANTPVTGKLHIWKNTASLRPLIDYTVSGAVVTLLYPRLSSDVFQNDYIK